VFLAKFILSFDKLSLAISTEQLCTHHHAALFFAKYQFITQFPFRSLRLELLNRMFTF